MNNKGVIFSSCDKAVNQPYNINLERLRDVEQAVIDKVLDTCPMSLQKRGHELNSGNLHGLVRNDTGVTMIYVCPVIDSYEPTDGQLIHAITLAQEVPQKANLNAIQLLVINLANGQVECINTPFEPPYGLLTEPVLIGKHCAKCEFLGQCNNV